MSDEKIKVRVTESGQTIEVVVMRKLPTFSAVAGDRWREFRLAGKRRRGEHE
jgi:hypothetical protein